MEYKMTYWQYQLLGAGVVRYAYEFVSGILPEARLFGKIRQVLIDGRWYNVHMSVDNRWRLPNLSKDTMFVHLETPGNYAIYKVPKEKMNILSTLDKTPTTNPYTTRDKIDFIAIEINKKCLEVLDEFRIFVK